MGLAGEGGGVCEINAHLLPTSHSYQPGEEQKATEPFCRSARRVMTRAGTTVEMYRFYSWYCIYIVVSAGAQRGWGPLCAPMDDQSCLIVFASVAAAGALILRHIPFRSAGQAFIARAYRVHKGSSLNNWTISYQGWHPYKDVPLTASAQTGEWIKPHSFVPKARPSSSASDHKISKGFNIEDFSVIRNFF